jgi:hypothetical protein
MFTQVTLGGRSGRLARVAGAPATVMELAGHSSFEMTLRYAHPAPNIHAEAVAKLDEPSDSTTAGSSPPPTATRPRPNRRRATR